MVKLIKDLLSDSEVWASESNKLNYSIYGSLDSCERELTIITKIIIK
jgi:hypothetical protein